MYDGGESHARERQLDARLRGHERDAVWQARGQQRYTAPSAPSLLHYTAANSRSSSLSRSPLSLALADPMNVTWMEVAWVDGGIACFHK